MDAPRELRRVAPFEVTRAEADDDGLTLEGYAAVFDSPTLIDSWEGTFTESIQRGAFAKTISERTPVMQFDHGTHPLIGSIPLGVIRSIREDDHGLFVRARLSDNWLIQPIRDAILDGAVNGMSFRFRVIQDKWNREDDPPHRTLVEVSAPELGPVVFPAYEDTDVGVRDAGAINELAVRMEQRLKSGTPEEGAAEESGTSEEAAREEGTSDEAADADEPAEAVREDTPDDESTTSTEPQKHSVMSPVDQLRQMQAERRQALIRKGVLT